MNGALRTTALVALAAAFAIAAVRFDLGRSCAEGELDWLSPALCSNTPAETGDPASLRERIARNPGDAPAYVALARALPPQERASALAAAAQVAPNEPNVLLMQAGAAAQKQDWQAAAQFLIALAQYRDDPAAPSTLARMVAAGQASVLVPLVRADSRWVFHTLRHVSEMPGAMPMAVPLIAQGLRTQALKRDEVGRFIVDLKNAGEWRDAYGLWVFLHPDGIPLLYNGSFEQPLNAGAFNWETLPAHLQPGAVVERLSVGPRDRIVEIGFNTRPVGTPILRQYVFAGPGRYVLEGEYRASRLRLGAGLAWTIACASGTPIAHSQPLDDTGGEWRPLRFEFTVPAECRDVANLSFSAVADADARTGGTGRVALRQLAIHATNSPNPPKIPQSRS